MSTIWLLQQHKTVHYMWDKISIHLNWYIVTRSEMCKWHMCFLWLSNLRWYQFTLVSYACVLDFKCGVGIWDTLLESVCIWEQDQWLILCVHHLPPSALLLDLLDFLYHASNVTPPPRQPLSHPQRQPKRAHTHIHTHTCTHTHKEPWTPSSLNNSFFNICPEAALLPFVHSLSPKACHPALIKQKMVINISFC